MGRIISNVKVTNLFNTEACISFDALVDTGAALLTLPKAWKEKLMDIKTVRKVLCETATQDTVEAEVCGPVEIQLEGFEPIFSEVMFLDMKPKNDRFEPLIGYIVLEQSQVAVDMLGHRLVPVKFVDLK